MANSGKEFVDFAFNMLSSCAKGTTTEMDARTIINRAYYGAHHEAKAAAKISNYSHDCHAKVIEHYQSANKLIANKLDGLFKSRKKADYDIHIDVAKPPTTLYREAQLSCTKASSILKELAVDASKANSTTTPAT